MIHVSSIRQIMYDEVRNKEILQISNQTLETTILSQAEKEEFIC